MPLFRKFLEILSKGDGEYPAGRVKKEFTDQERKGIVQTFSELRANGFFSNGIDARGNVKWLVITKSEVHRYRDKDLGRLKVVSMSELSRIAKSYGSVVKDMPNLKSGDIDREKVLE